MDIFMFLQRVNKTSVFVETLKASSSESKVMYSKIRNVFYMKKLVTKSMRVFYCTHITHIHMRRHTLQGSKVHALVD